MPDNHLDRRAQTCDPATGERRYTTEERTWLAACEAYREAHGKHFLRATDYLIVARRLGYHQG